MTDHTADKLCTPPSKVPCKTFIGVGQFEGWKFELVESPAAGVPGYADGCPGYIRTQLTPAKCSVEHLKSDSHAYDKRFNPKRAVEMEQFILHREPEWIEAQWLVEWLKHGSIKEVKGGVATDDQTQSR